MRPCGPILLGLVTCPAANIAPVDDLPQAFGVRSDRLHRRRGDPLLPACSSRRSHNTDLEDDDQREDTGSNGIALRTASRFSRTRCGPDERFV